MRSQNYRDFVLHPIAYRAGLDPAAVASNNFEDSEARAIGTYINAWVRKLWTVADWPEWSVFSAFVPQNHIVELNDDSNPFNFNVGKVLSVSLLDPRQYSLPLNVPFTQLSTGVFVGFDHGNEVFIKFLVQPPVFTAVVWDASVTYAKGQVTYDPPSGECYVSLLNGNKNNPPSSLSVNMPPPQIVQQPFVPGGQGFDAQAKVMYAQMVRADGVTVVDPPLSGQIFVISVYDVNNSLLGSVSHTCNGTDSLATILGGLHTNLAAVPALSAFTFVEDDNLLTLTISNASEFSVTFTFSPTSISFSTYGLITAQTQSYIPAVAPSTATQQQTKVTLTNQFVLPGTILQFTFNDTTGASHSAQYTIMVGDGVANALAGLAAAIQAQASTDMIMAQLVTTLSPSTGSMVVSSPFQGGVGVDWIFLQPHLPPGPGPTPEPGGKGTWWGIVQFPFDLIDPVVAGANVELLKEWGQMQAGLMESQQLPDIVSTKTTVATGQNYEPLAPRAPGGVSRYVMR